MTLPAHRGLCKHRFGSLGGEADVAHIGHGFGEFFLMGDTIDGEGDTALIHVEHGCALS